MQVVVVDGPVFDDCSASPDFEVALVGVDDDVEVGVGAELFDEDSAECFFEDADHCGPVDVFEFFELCESINQIVAFHYNLLSLRRLCVLLFFAVGVGELVSGVRTRLCRVPF